MIRSIRVNLTLWYIGILTVVLCLFGGVLYTSVAANLARDVDEFLVLEVDDIASDIFSYGHGEWDAEKLTAPSAKQNVPPPTFQMIQSEINSGEGLEGLITRWADEEGELEAYRPVRLFTADGKPLTASARFIKLDLPVLKETLEKVHNNQTVYETFELPHNHVRLITRPVTEDNRVLYIVQVAISLEQMDSSLTGLRIWLLVLIPSTIVGTSVVGWFLAARALKPVDRMVEQARRIGAQDLHERIDMPRTGDELERLAKTFNSMLDRLEHAFRGLRQFSTAASHELRTPLTIMKGELEVALRKPREVEEYQRVLKTQLEALNEMADIVEQLLKLARSEEGEKAIEWRQVDLGTLVEKVYDTLQTIAESKKIQVSILGNGSVWVQGEQRLLERLIANLLHNALKHTPAEGNVKLETRSYGSEACLIVEDTGPGISSDDLPKIFDRFFDPKPTDPNTTGFGLGICRWIAEAHHGRIEVTNSAGKGAKFMVWLPLFTPSS